jgi:hypothetical protein
MTSLSLARAMSANRVSFGSSTVVDACGTVLRVGEALSEDILVAEVHAGGQKSAN